MKMRLKEILQVTAGKLLQGNEAVFITDVSTDTRTIKKGDLFIAVAGENFDGHRFLKEAKDKGAAAIIIAKRTNLPLEIPVIQVKNSVVALGKIARAHRDRFKIPIIAVTGSAGKTTIKEMAAAVLSQRYNVLKNVATHNNHMGVPQTLFKLNSSHDIAVIELGTDRFGDIRWLTQIANPTVALFTNIGESHLECLKTPRGVFKEKFELVRTMRPSGTVIFNADNRYLAQIPARKVKQRLVAYGINKKCQYQASAIEFSKEGKLNFKVKGKTFELNSPVFHNIYNALAAICCGQLFKIRYNDIQRALAGFDSLSGRQNVQKLGCGWVIDDTYNANPVSFRSAIETLNHINFPGRKILVCGDMLELGSRAKALHYALGRDMASINPDLVLTVGKFSQILRRGIKDKNKSVEAYACGSLDAVHARLKSYCRSGDAVLVKGSRGMLMERTIEFLKRTAKG